MPSEHSWVYHTTAWQSLRIARLNAEPLCRLCSALGLTVPATVVDHIRPHRGDRNLAFDPDNLQSLCKPCHDRHKQAQERSGVLPRSEEHTTELQSLMRHPYALLR